MAGSANGRESQSATLSSGEQLDIDLTLKAHQQVDDITLGIMVRDRFGQDIFGANSYQLGQRISLEEGSEQAVRLTLNADIAPANTPSPSACTAENTTSTPATGGTTATYSLK